MNPARQLLQRPFYAAILWSDSSLTDHGQHPIAIVTSTGYVGSIWNSNGLLGAVKLENGIGRRRFFAIRIHIERCDYGSEVKAWVWANPL